MDRTTAIRTLTAALIVGVASQALFVGADLGINVPLLVVATLAAGVAIAAGGRRLDRLDLWLPVAALAVAATVSLRAEPTLRFLNLVTAASLLAASMAAFAGAAVTRRSAIAIVATGMVVMAWVVAGILRVTMAARRPGTGPGWRERMPAWVRPVARGLFLAIPILAVFVALFSSADAIFASLTANLFGWQIDLGELPARLSVGFLVAWVAAGLLGVAAGAAELDWPQNPHQMQSLGAAVAEPLPLLPRLGVTEALTILVAVDVLFAVFVSLQVAYLFGGLDTLAAGGITYANYARRGFFELVMVTGLAGGLVVGLHAIVVNRTRAFTGAAVGLALLTFVILSSAALRLRIYQEAYGWTELRFYIYATIAWLGIGIVAAIIFLARNRMRWLVHAMTIAAVVVLIGVNLIGPQRHVAEQNVARLLDPSLVPADGRIGLDIYYAQTLEGFDAVPALVTALPALGAADRASLMTDLEYRWQQLQQPEALAWPAWNLARQRAREALEPLFDR